MVEAYTEELFLLYNSQICRLCGEENSSGYSLFISDEEDFSTLINQYLPLKISDDGKYPRWICPGCHLQVESTVQFFNLVITGQENLRQIFKAQCEEQLKIEGLISSDIIQNEFDTINQNSISTEVLGTAKFENSEFLFSIDHDLSQRMSMVPEIPKRKRGRPPKPPPEKLEAQQNAFDEEEIEMNKIKMMEITNETDSETQSGRRKRRIKVPLRFQEVVQGKELDKIFIETGIIDKNDLASDIDETIPINCNDFKMDISDEIIGHVQDNKGLNLGDLIVVNNQQKDDHSQKPSILRKKTRFMCDICKICFYYENKFVEHRSSHKNVRFECTQCLVNFQQRLELIEHQTTTEHRGEGIIEEFKETSLEMKNDLRIESKLFEISKDYSTSDEQISEEILVKEKINDSVNQEIHIYPNQFEDVFHENDEMEEAAKVLHELQNNDNIKQFQDDENHLIQTNLDETIENNENLSDSQLTNELSKTNEKQNNYFCHICQKTFYFLSSFTYHKNNEHSSGRRFICSKCSKCFKNKQLLQRHLLVHSDLKPFVCDFCDSSFKTKTNLQHHELIHKGEKKFRCEICGQAFAHKHSLTLHLRWHSGKKPFKCETCGKSFTQYGNMQEHKRIHTGERPFECHICSNKFKTSSQCKNHIKRHEIDRPIKCTKCERSFVNTEEYRIHERRHNNIKPYKCSICAKSFIELCALKKHSRLHTGEKPYPCIECGRKFADRSNLKKHLKMHENKKRLAQLSYLNRTNEISLNELTTNSDTNLDNQSLIINNNNDNNSNNSNTNSNSVWNFIEEDSYDPMIDTNNQQQEEIIESTISTRNDNLVSNQIVYVTYQDPINPIDNKTTVYVVDPGNESEIVENFKSNNSESNEINDSNIDGKNTYMLQQSNVFLNNAPNDLSTNVLLDIQTDDGAHLEQTEFFQCEEKTNSIQLTTIDGKKVQLFH